VRPLWATSYFQKISDLEKVAQLAKDCPSATSLGCFIFKNNQNELSKVAKLEKIAHSGQPVLPPYKMS
jgi:hypothetical protein